MREVSLPSGAVLKITPSPFRDSKALYQAILREAKGVTISTKTELTSLYKDIFCLALSSPEIEKALGECLKRCTYNDLRIDEDTFEPLKAREDYLIVCVEVAKENVFPFMKSLYAEYLRIVQMIESVQA